MRPHAWGLAVDARAEDAGWVFFLTHRLSLLEVNSFSGCFQHTPKMSQGPTLFSCGIMGK